MSPVRISFITALGLAVLAASSALLSRGATPSKESILDGMYN